MPLDSPDSLRIVTLPHGWVRNMPSAANLLDGAGPPLVNWGLAGALLTLGLVFHRTRPRLSIAAAACASFLLALSTNGLVDDAYIQFRYAANAASGIGPVFNAGEHIEGASGGIWILVLAGLSWLSHWDVAVLGRVLSLVLTPVAVLLAAWAGSARGNAESGAAAALLWALVPTSSLYAATGLETTAFCVSLFLLAGATLRDQATPAVAGGALIASLRPEGLILGLFAFPFFRRLPRAGKAGLTSLAGAALLLVILRLWYYGLPVPRSAIVKGVTGASTFSTGIIYLGRCLLEWWPLLGAIPFAIKKRNLLLPALVPALLWALMAVARGGDWMPGTRYLLPLLVFLVLVLAVEARPKPFAFLSGCALVWTLVQLAPFEEPSRSPVGGLYRIMSQARVESRWWESLGVFIGKVVPPGTRLASGPSGALPYASRLPAFDLYGLCSEVTHVRDGEPGHRLWGLASAVQAGVDVVYPGAPLSQRADWATLKREALAHVSDVPDFERHFEPIGIAHFPEYHSDMLADIIWVRRGSGLFTFKQKNPR